MTLRMLDPGPLSLIEDLGRPGLSTSGVGPSGVFDRAAARIANSIVGNPADCAVIENIGGLALESRGVHVVCVTGAAGRVWVDGRPADTARALVVHDRQILRLETPALGVRWVVAVAGGIEVPETLGSRSRDTLAGLGPAPLARHEILAIGQQRGRATAEQLPTLLTSHEHMVRVVMGPRDNWFTRSAVSTLLSHPWRVDPASDRIGVRLEGPALDRAADGELPSEPVVRGSIQVTTSGRPVVLGPDHPVTGGYPVIATVIDHDTDRLAQVRPGDVVRFARTHG